MFNNRTRNQVFLFAALAEMFNTNSNLSSPNGVVKTKLVTDGEPTPRSEERKKRQKMMRSKTKKRRKKRGW